MLADARRAERTWVRNRFEPSRANADDRARECRVTQSTLDRQDAPAAPGPERSERIVYESPTLRVRHVAGGLSPTLIVTFAHVEPQPSVSLPGYAEGFLSKTSYDALYVTCSSNGWYQYPDMSDALSAACEITRNYERVICYGMSMGAFAAYRFSNILGAHRTVAIAPQFTPDPTSPPYDRRWATEVSGINFPANDEPAWVADEFFVIYDPVDFDYKHVRLLGDRYPLTEIRLPYAGHHLTIVLAEMGVFSSAIHMLFAETVDAALVRRNIRAVRHRSPVFLTNLAQASRNLGRRRALLGQVLALVPDNAEVNAMVGDVQWRQGDLAGAESTYRRAVALGPQNPWVLHRLSDVLSALGQADEAHRLAAESEALGACTAEVVNRIVYRLLWLDRCDDAAAVVSQALAKGLPADEANSLLSEIAATALARRSRRTSLAVRRTLADPDLDRQIAGLREVCSDDPGSPEPLLALGDIFMRLGDVGAAAQALRGAVERRPHDPWPRYRLSEALLGSGDSEEALAQALRSRELSGGEALYDALIARVFLARGQLDEAEEALRSGARNGMVTDAVDYLTAQIGSARAAAVERNLLGQLERAPADGSPAARIEWLRQAVTLDGGSAQVYVDLGDALQANGDPIGAVDAYAQAVALSPDDPWTHRQHSEALLGAGRLDAALEAAQKARGLNGADPIYDLSLARVLGQMRRWDEAEAALLLGGQNGLDAEVLAFHLEQLAWAKTSPGSSAQNTG